MIIDLKLNTKALRERHAVETDPVLRHNLELVTQHIEFELDGNVQAVLDTLVEHPVYHLFQGSLTGAKLVPVSKERESYVWLRDEAVGELYRQMLPLKAQFAADRLVVDRHCVLLEGVMYVPYPGEQVRQMGFPTAEANRWYIGTGRCVNFFNFDTDSGLISGEDFYVDPGLVDDLLEHPCDEIVLLPGYPEPLGVLPRADVHAV